MKTILIIAAFIMAWASAQSQSYFEDTVWTKKTDQSSGFYQVKFSNNDSIIVGHGNGMSQQPDTKFCLFYDSYSGEEINRIPGNREVFFFNNDLNFLKLNDARNVFEIFDTETFQIIDTLENDGTKLYPNYTLSNDESKLVCVKSGGLRTWDMESRRIINSKDFPTSDGLLNISTEQLAFNCYDSKILIGLAKTYQINNSPPQQVEIRECTIFDAITLDSIDNITAVNDYRLSKTCQYIAIKTGDKYEGVEIYDFNTKQLLHKLPVNGPSLRVLEFSPDDKYLVTNPNIMIWDVLTGENTYVYTSGSTNCLDVSHDGTYLFSSVGRYIYKWHARFGDTSTPKENQFSSLIYPNPTTGEVNINNVMLSGAKHPEIKVFDILGIEHPATVWHPSEEGNIRIDISSLSPGVYFVKIGSYLAKFVKM